MKVLSTSVPIFTRDIEAAIERYEALARETVRERFDVRATFVVDSLAEYDAHLRSTGATTLQGPSPTPASTNLIVRDVEGAVFEFVEPHSKE